MRQISSELEAMLGFGILFYDLCSRGRARTVDTMLIKVDRQLIEELQRTCKGQQDEFDHADFANWISSSCESLE